MDCRLVVNLRYAQFLGAFGVVACHPFDVIKCRLQSQTIQSPTRRFEVAKSIYNVYRTESITGLYKGMASPLAGNTMVYGLLFGVNEVIASSQQFNKNNPWHHVFGGFMSGSIQCVVGTPSELSKIRMQLQGIGINYTANKNYKKHYSNSFHCLYVIARRHGLRGVYRGLFANLMRDGPGFAVYIGLYEYLFTFFEIDTTSKRLMLSPIFGAIAGCAGWISTYPFDTIKTEFQAKSHYTSYTEVVTFFRQSEMGLWRSLWNGLGACMIRTAAQVPTMFYTLELFRIIASGSK
ncbi:mitochondrial basic amino acids transporter-like [Symsagittifera roscoffensis]|uniref:mitochondrial basic amino acids transporter-like n=1 Tax=Symsagittifera roscoffensis TaxID=84072 RepID=UPI00307BA030